MSMSPHVRRLRATVGSALLVLPAVTGILFDDRRPYPARSASGIRCVERSWRGSVDPGETPADAVVREVWEETGLYTAPVRLLGVYGGPSCLRDLPQRGSDRST